jgi:hypothetical protein
MRIYLETQAFYIANLLFLHFIEVTSYAEFFNCSRNFTLIDYKDHKKHLKKSLLHLRNLNSWKLLIIFNKIPCDQIKMGQSRSWIICKFFYVYDLNFCSILSILFMLWCLFQKLTDVRINNILRLKFKTCLEIWKLTLGRF